MRLGVVLRAPWAADAARAEELGFDLGWIDERVAPAPLVAAASIAPATGGLRVVASLAAGPHPVTLAEEAAVADLTLGGRLVLALHADEELLLAETVELLHQAFAARPFRHAGPRWTVPEQRPEHQGVPDRVRITPAPAQLELPIWLGGAAAAAVSARHGESLVGGVEDGAASMLTAWTAVATALGGAAARLRRPALRAAGRPDGSLDVPSLVAALRDDRDTWGMDVAVLELPQAASDSARDALLCAIAHEVRPRLQLATLPDGVEDWWARLRPDGS
jgi:alkanesulfonate monooxygenase SsuD/methylene tetrahydromethanopterin reductase-like flavin-dependent oxidoreductase (luciferase family)